MKTNDIAIKENRFGDEWTAEESNAREDFLKAFEIELDQLIFKAYAEAKQIGGQFRAPGIQREIDRIVKATIFGM